MRTKIGHSVIVGDLIIPLTRSQSRSRQTKSIPRKRQRQRKPSQPKQTERATTKRKLSRGISQRGEQRSKAKHLASLTQHPAFSIMPQVHHSLAHALHRVYDICLNKFGFMANPALSQQKNFKQILLNNNFTPEKLATYPTNARVHNLCKTQTDLPPNLLKTLGLGLGFCLSLHRKGNNSIDFDRLRRDIRLKFHTFDSDSDYNPKLYVRNPEWEPNPAPNDVEDAITTFEQTTNTIFKRYRNKPHIYNVPIQAINTLRQVKKAGKLFVQNTDKNLGPGVIETDAMIDKVYADHLSDTSTYQCISESKANEINQINYRRICHLMIDAKDVDTATKTFFRRRLNGQRNKAGRMFHRQDLQLPYLYIMYKVHKSPLKTRPVESQTNSILEPLSQWLDYQLQRVLHLCPSLLKDSWQLLRDIKQLQRLPANTRIYTADAKSMYTNINVDHGLTTMADWFILHKHHLPLDYPTDKILDGLNLIMRNNVFHFGNQYYQQLNGTAMGTSVACAYATIYYSYHEETQLLNDTNNQLLFYRRLIDDALILQIQTPGVHSRFIYQMNNFGPAGKRLEWEYTKPSLTVDFLDFTSIIENGSILTKTYQKPMNLYLYRPPSSAQPPSILYGLIYGTIHRLYWQNSKTEWFVHYLNLFYQRLQDRGHKSSDLAPLFIKAAQRVEHSSIPKPKPKSDRPLESPNDSIYLHLPYHPQDPPRHELQEAFQSTLLPVFNKYPDSDVKRMVIAYSRAPNIADMVKRNRLKPSVDTSNVSGPTDT